MAEKNSFDIVIIGAGISGINAAYRIQTELPHYSYTILESRNGIGGTWDFFKYPGLRSDSDLHTFGFPWKPWEADNSIADGASISEYINTAASENGIDRKVQFLHKLQTANWSSDQQAWQLSVSANGEKTSYHARFIIFASGYYNYDEPLATEIPGLKRFQGTTVHPQFWPEDLDYTGKKMVIIGSGATAVTLLPVLAEKAEKVTMLQRSPGYLISLPQIKNNGLLAKILPNWITHKLTRLQFLVLPWLFFQFCRRYPAAARKVMYKRTAPQLPDRISMEPHFTPSYNPWEQRLCACPDGDFFASLRSGKGDVATGHIESVTEGGVTLKSGQKLEADILITATGLKMQLAGGVKISVDGELCKPSDKFMWKGIMLQDVPNAAMVLGYTNASWTLGADATAWHITRLLKHMDAQGISSAVPKCEDKNVQPSSIFNLNSTYVKKAEGSLPSAGDRGPWKPRSNYFYDLFQAKFGSVTDSLQFHRTPVM